VQSQVQHLDGVKTSNTMPTLYQTNIKKLGDFRKKRFVSNSSLELAMESSKQ
jgi:hypothetical protein